MKQKRARAVMNCVSRCCNRYGGASAEFNPHGVHANSMRVWIIMPERLSCRRWATLRRAARPAWPAAGG
ncbi:hypothetical protein [Metallibacterium scheffleri]|uniref:hypothetical protein n=1 Tax=Metallibacterium scheffleri TaxID=993689 RepID=UPI0010A0A9D8|nr:hypothetical protein [Metallibacterium scheffleri]